MQLTAPDYYEKFKCIAEKCKNSCCIGWEIDIDPETLDFYFNILGEWRKRFKKSISLEGETPHFITDEKGRCPFLNENGLCDIIAELGEDDLCQICYDHPRFYNCFSAREEMGLGLCCEAAADLILGNQNKFSLNVLEENDGEATATEDELSAFSERDTLFSIFQNRGLSISQRMEQVAKLYSVSPFSGDISALIKKHRALERLNPEWDEFLNCAEQSTPTAEALLEAAEQKIPLPTEQLLCYLTYRYFAQQAVLLNQKNALEFILETTLFCLAVAHSYYGEFNLQAFTDVCRRFSLEAEYSEDNITSLLKGDF